VLVGAQRTIVTINHILYDDPNDMLADANFETKSSFRSLCRL